jgi:hypothetical protein
MVKGCAPSATVSSTTLIVNDAEIWPAGIVTFAGTVTAEVSLEPSVTATLVANVPLTDTVALFGHRLREN